MRNRWLVPAFACSVILAAGAAGVVWRWVKGSLEPRHLTQGQLAYENRDWASAERIAREQLRKNHDDPDALRLLSRALFRQRRDQPATAISETLTRNTMTAEDYYLLGQACVRSQKADVAIKLWQKASALEPGHFESRLALEQAYFRLDRLSEAKQEADALLRVPGREALAQLMRGQICVQQADPAGASEALQLALERPMDWASMVEPAGVVKQAGRALLQIGQSTRARALLLASTRGERDHETCWLLARCDLRESVSSEPAVSAGSRAYRQSHPMEAEPAPFVGEARCAGCHADLFRDQQKSRHARTFFRKSQVPPVPFPETPIADPSDSRVTHVFKKSDAGVEVRAQVDGKVVRTIVDYAFGSGDRGLTPVGHGPDGQALECRLSFYANRVGWDVTSGQSLEAKLPAASYAGRALAIDELRACIDCHHTNPRSILTGAGPESADHAIGCERCHGPGGHHVKVVSSKDFSANGDLDLAIARPGLATGAPVIGLCAQCHSSRRNAVVDPEAPSSIRFHGTTLTRSRCYLESGKKLDCVKCHNPHSDAETSLTWYEARCLQCHSVAGAAANRGTGHASDAAAGRHLPCPVQPASGCIGCHMPRRESTTAHTAFTDHFIRVHREPDAGTKRRP